MKHGPESFANLSCSEVDIAAAVNASHALVALWYNPTEKFKHCHEDLNLLRTRMASTKITPLSCLPPCWELFKENIKRVIWQVPLWTFASMLDFGGKPDDFGWEVRNGILKPVMYKCKIAAEEVQGLICDCKGNKKFKINVHVTIQDYSL